MGITAYFYQFEKKANSTKQPLTMIQGDFAVTVELKSVTNLFTPSLTISADRFKSGDDITNPMKYTYCYLPDFERYYFVRSWSWVLGRWECSLEVDVLASFKTAIGNTTAYVLRSASRYNPKVIDTKYPTKKGVIMENSHLNTSPWSTNIYSAPITDGFFVVAIANHDANSIGATSHYAFSAAAMQEFLNIMYSAPTWMNITDTSISQDLQKMLLNPIQYITGIMWIPTGFNTSGATGISTIPYGWWNITLTQNRVYRIGRYDITKSLSFDFDIINHPQYDANKREWLNLSPYTSVAFRFEPFGMFSLDASKVMNFPRIRCVVWVDVITGIANLSVYTCYYDSGWVMGELVYTTTAQLGVPISVAQMSVDASRLASTSTWVSGAALAVASDDELQEHVSNSVKAVGNALKQPNTWVGKMWNWMTNPEYRRGVQSGAINPDKSTDAWSTAVESIVSTVKEVAPSVGNAALAISGVCESKGASGCFTMLAYIPELIFYFQEIVETDDTYYGIPLCAKVKINTLSGFVLCANSGDFAPNSTQIERQAVIALMQAGFYYE